jgi:hypothetical protein
VFADAIAISSGFAIPDASCRALTFEGKYLPAKPF